MAFLGYIIQNIVYLVNVIWFDELKVEWLLFECLQDMTGGSIVLGMGLYALMVDYTKEENRTKRMAVLDAFVILGDMIYVIFRVKDINVKQNNNEDDVLQQHSG